MPKRKDLHGESSLKKKRSRCRQRCGHCQQLLSKSQYHEHRRLYFNPSLDQWKTVEYIKNIRSSASAPEDVPGSSSSESEGVDGNLDSSSFGPAVQDLPGSDSDDCGGSESYIADQQAPLESDESDESDHRSSEDEDEGTDYVDSESSDIEDLLQSEEVELPQPSPPRTNQQRTQAIVIWLVYFVLVWQYKNYVSDNAIEQLLKFVQQLLFCIGELLAEEACLCTPCVACTKEGSFMVLGSPIA
ncbi:hypothetical protein OS493_000527 [Desmophyllum pertusum]|uniref:Uncharacterized protein n=1 Tax=Desmophyllum pertusum TaxID=174260 RepID=A0A9X0A768_9CNID|nr:hypothetical protein OS493_000527 [Desmophyllum pertusum]